MSIASVSHQTAAAPVQQQAPKPPAQRVDNDGDADDRGSARAAAAPGTGTIVDVDA